MNQGGTDVIVIEIKCTINVIVWIIMKPSPIQPQYVEKLSSKKPVAGTKRLGTDALRICKSQKIEAMRT